MNKIIKNAVFALTLIASLSAFAGKPVNVNKADATQLATSLEGIGSVKAKRIVEYREKFKISFKTLKDLEKINGIGEKTLQANAQYIKF